MAFELQSVSQCTAVGGNERGELDMEQQKHSVEEVHGSDEMSEFEGGSSSDCSVTEEFPKKRQEREKQQRSRGEGVK